ncbi:S41 family peptidase [Streptomyces sp. NPDC003247]|uniref:S41 family peptidase n=1 Tax=Streptomyces sp. NPDC003247 TaxID=3364677 RepID=UPI00368493A8
MTDPADDTTPAFIQQAAEPVRAHLATSTPLRSFLDGAGTLTLEERRLIVDQALVLLDQNYVHLPLKTAMHAVNPVQRLRVLRRRLERQTQATMPAEWLFHAEVSEIFHSVRDLHTNYLLPAPFAGKIAFLPFLVEPYTDAQGTTHFMVTHVAQGFDADGFRPGVEITHWSGIPVSAAVDLNAARFAGSNTPARRSRGVQSLTVRPLRIHLPPFEEWVTVSYTDDSGTQRELRENWRIVENLPPMVDADAISTAALAQGLDLDADETGRAKVLLFAPRVVAQERAVQADEQAPGLRPGEIATSMPTVFTARTVETSSGRFGHIRVFTFNVTDPVAFVREFVRLIGQLPQNGLIVDVRDNGGGHIHAAEFALQVLTPRRIAPEPVQFINTPLNLRICRQHQDASSGIDLGAWVPSMEQAVEIGATFSSAFPITPEDGANAIGQQYFGPVVLITNARCYSATDIFAAGFQDHRIGPVLGTDENTGAGGANVWTHELLSALLAEDRATPYVPLPKGAGMRVSVRRTLRVGALSGTPVEDLGVVPDELHRMTRRDLLEDNADLFDQAGRLLQERKPHAVSVTDAVSVDGSLRIKVKATNIDRVDVYVDQRPGASVDLSDGQADVTVPGAAAARAARVDGFEAGQLVASTTEQLH